MLKLILFCLRRANCKLHTRLLSTANSQFNNDAAAPTSTLKDYTPVYSFPYIRAISMVNRLKLYHLAFTSAAIPTSLILHECNVIHAEAVLVTGAIGLTGCLSLFTLGFFTDKFVGFIYLNKEENLVRVAYIDFWGRRRDEEVPVKDVVPFSEVPTSFMDGLYLKFNRFSAKKTMKINVHFGKVLDKKKFKKVFAIE